MKFNINDAVDVLAHTPQVVEDMLRNIPNEFVMNNEGPDTWSPYDIVGHLIHGEKTDWVERMNIILSDKPDKRFIPFDRFAQFENSKGKSLEQLINEFKGLRKSSIDILKSKNITENDLKKTGIHPEFGEVTLSQLLSTWVVHDLCHIAQIARVMAKQYKANTGPWINYLPVLTR
jgi:hypothetical protein